MGANDRLGHALGTWFAAEVVGREAELQAERRGSKNIRWRGKTVTSVKMKIIFLLLRRIFS